MARERHARMPIRRRRRAISPISLYFLMPLPCRVAAVAMTERATVRVYAYATKEPSLLLDVDAMRRCGFISFQRC